MVLSTASTPPPPIWMPSRLATSQIAKASPEETVTKYLPSAAKADSVSSRAHKHSIEGLVLQSNSIPDAEAFIHDVQQQPRHSVIMQFGDIQSYQGSRGLAGKAGRVGGRQACARQKNGSCYDQQLKLQPVLDAASAALLTADKRYRAVATKMAALKSSKNNSATQSVFLIEKPAWRKRLDGARSLPRRRPFEGCYSWVWVQQWRSKRYEFPESPCCCLCVNNLYLQLSTIDLETLSIPLMMMMSIDRQHHRK